MRAPCIDVDVFQRCFGGRIISFSAIERKASSLQCKTRKCYIEAYKNAIQDVVVHCCNPDYL
jgi:hypothetical protein